MKTILLVVLASVVSVGIGYTVALQRENVLPPFISPSPTPVPTPLSVYSIENLQNVNIPSSPITIAEEIKKDTEVTARSFSYRFAPNPTSKDKKTVSGMIHHPNAPGVYPVIVMFRGYVPPATYFTGAGTNPSATVFARNGFITIAPDFLGYGASDPRPDDPYEARFQTYTTALSLLSSIENLNDAFDATYSGRIRADTTKIALWGHSNGGHIALATLSMTKRPYPTVLWAPVSKSFPYSILAFSDEDDDNGKAERKDLARFESVYDTELFSPAKYYKDISASIRLFQGGADEEVPVWWSNDFVQSMKKYDKDISYTVYPGADHNLRPAWNAAVEESILFYKKAFSL